MALSKSFDHVADDHARILILGSMPGIESLRQRQYYAHPRNQFWDFMQALFGIERNLAYPERLLKLQRHHIALWDVAHQCERPGSLDSSIQSESIIPNDFQRFYQVHPDIQALFFNGQKAAQMYQKLVLPKLSTAMQTLPRHILPSSSPAHAAMHYDAKLKQWLKIAETLATVAA